MDQSGDITRLLAEMKEGKRDAEDRLLELVYGELRGIARRHMRRERDGHTLQATELANEAYLRLAGSGAEFQNRAHFYAVAAQVMRRILVDYARKRNSAKRGNGQRVEFDHLTLRVESNPEELLALDFALQKLAGFDARRAKVVELRVFGGLSDAEMADVFGVSTRTIKRDWVVAKAWLFGELGGPGGTFTTV